MASIEKIKNKKGEVTSYRIIVSGGFDCNGKRIKHKLAWKPERKMTERQTEKALQRAAADFERSIEQGYQLDMRQTFAEYAAYFVRLKEDNGAAPNTIALMRYKLDHILPEIGHMRLSDIRPQHLNKLYHNLMMPGQRRDKENNRPFSAGNVQSIRSLVHNIFAQAEREMLIPYNPADKAQKMKAAKKEPNYFQPIEIANILDALDSEPLKWRALVQMLIVTGCRRGEIIGLHWDDIDLTTGDMKISRQICYTSGLGAYEKQTKTGNVRFVRIPTETLTLLKRYQVEQAAEQLASGWGTNNVDYVFAARNGEIMLPVNINSWLSRFSARHGLPHINPHAFRHSVASMLIANGVDVVSVSHQLGHKNVATTENVYAHAIDEARAKVSDTIADVMLRRKKG